jgi:hypothetical protein
MHGLLTTGESFISLFIGKPDLVGKHCVDLCGAQTPGMLREVAEKWFDELVVGGDWHDGSDSCEVHLRQRR